MLTDILRYDVGRLTTSLADLRVPVVAVQATYGNEKRERRPMSKGQTTPYLDMLRARVPSARIEIIEDTGHFPQIDEAAQTNALLDSFLATIPARWGILTPGRPITALRFGCPASKGRWVSLNACSVALEGMDTMKFGLCYIPDYHEELSGSWYDWYEGMIAEVKLAELLGFHGAWFAEHRVSVTLDHG